MSTGIFLCGAHSTGKTTLISEICKVRNFQCEQEYVRKLMKSLGLNKDSLDWKKHPNVFKDFQLQILKTQIEIHKKNEKSESGRYYIADRGIDPLVYTRYYLGQDVFYELLHSPEAQSCIERFRKSILFVIEPQEECLEDDGVRFKPIMSELIEFTAQMKNTLEELKIPYHLIDFLDLQKRVDFVSAKVQ